MKKLLALVCALMMLCTLSFAEEEKAPIDLTNVKLLYPGTLTVGLEAGYEPFEFFAEDGVTFTGFDVELMQAIADKLGLELNIINTSFTGIFASLDVNYDVVCSAVTVTPERKETMIFSTPYINNYQAVVVKVDDPLTVNSFMDLDGMVVGVQKGTTSDELMSDYASTGTINLTVAANEKIAYIFTQLGNGEIQAVVCDEAVAEAQLAKAPGAFRIAYLDDKEPEQFAVAFSMENTALQTAVNEAIAELEAEGYLAELFDYWFAE